MKTQNILLLLLSAIFVCGCTTNQVSNKDTTSEEKSSQSSSSSSHSSSGSTSTGPTKINVPAHTLSDSNPPVTIYDDGEQVTESTWNSFKNGNASKFSNHYNFLYTAFISGTNYQQEWYTKNGYGYNSLQGSTFSTMYYEKKSGSTFYQYVKVSDGYLRQETSFNLTNKFTSRILDEINVHMFEFSNYTWDADFQVYKYDGGTFSSVVQFKKGYLYSLRYTLGSIQYSITNMFDTTVDIPKSYYYA